MTDFKTRDVFLVNFDPSVGHEYKKIRPAVIIQSEKTLKNTAGNTSLITIMPITSQVTNCQTEDVKITKSKSNGLFADSLVKVNCIHSFDRKRFLKKIGIVSEEVMEEVIKYLCVHFDLKN